MSDAAGPTALRMGPGLGAAAQVCVDESAAIAGAGADRVRRTVEAHYASLWRFLRRLGVHESSVEDAAQQACFVFAQRIDAVAPGCEKGFLFGVALRVSQAARREQQRRPYLAGDELLAEVPALGPEADAELDDRRARAVLDAILDAMPLDLRTVFVLYELDEMTMAEIALALAIRPGTVASRLRRAREAFTALSRRAQAQMAARARGPVSRWP